MKIVSRLYCLKQQENLTTLAAIKTNCLKLRISLENKTIKLKRKEALTVQAKIASAKH
jgi:hypothetical protein